MDPVWKARNLARWNELAGIHARSEFYDLEGFKAGKSSLRSIEVEELGDVAGKSLLHLQCHFGIDTLSWVRRGARVTGVDFSEEAIALARSLSRELGLDARFVCSDVYDLRQALSGQFDVVYTSYGALCWLADLKRWAQIAAGFVRPGGTFYMVEVHPIAFMLDDRPETTDLRVGYSYFHSPEPIREDKPGSYADRKAAVTNSVEYTWTHGLGDVVTAIAAAGLRIEFLHEFPFGVCATMPGMEQCADGWWRVMGQPELVPFLFSLKAIKPGLV
jgi:SAM-dependent methyltransferase